MKAVFLLLCLTILGCRGDEELITQLILLDELPPTFHHNATPEIVIRTNFSGRIQFQEADKFKVLLNITAPSIEEVYTVSSELVDHKGRLLLQVFEKPTTTSSVSLPWIFVVIGCLTGVVLLLTTAYVVWWYMQEKHLVYGRGTYLTRGQLYRSRSMVLGAAAAELLGNTDQHDDMVDGEEDTERRRLEKLRVSLKPETIMEESEESSDDTTNPKQRFKMSATHLQRGWTQRQRENQLSNENVHGSGILDYPDQSGDELENDLSPDQIIAGADGNYTPLDEIDDLMQLHISNSRSTAKLPNPRGNLDYNIQTSKSDGDLLGDTKKVSEKEKIIAPLVAPKPKKTPTKEIPVPKRAEPNIYQRGFNLRPPGDYREPRVNDLSRSPGKQQQHNDQIRAQVHTPENHYVNNSFGQYIALQRTPDQMSRSRASRESNDAYELYTYPADIPLSTFKTTNVTPEKSPARNVPMVKPKPVIHSGSPKGFDFNQLDPTVKIGDSEPISPGNFSMLSEGSSSDVYSNGDDDDGDFMRMDDSDLDIPPPDTDADLLSNTSLPLPSPPPMENQFMQYDTRGHISQLSPRQSLISPGEGTYGTVIAITGSPSPGGPFSKHSVNGDRFVFPPPPNEYAPPQHSAMARRELYQGDAAGEYVGLPLVTQGQESHRQRHLSLGSRDKRKPGGQQAAAARVRHYSGGPQELLLTKERRTNGAPLGSLTQPEATSEKKPSGGSRKGKIPKHLHLTVLTTFCVLSVLTGVYCATSPPEKTVNIIVYVPARFPYRNSTIHTAIGKSVQVTQSDGMKWFDSHDPILTNFNSSLCDWLDQYSVKPCTDGCDENTASCICHHGYEMINDECQDINECQRSLSGCETVHRYSGCANTRGSYKCLCMGNNLYSHRGKCLECDSPCEDGTFEIQPCRGDRQSKICKDCTTQCGENYFMNQPCSKERDADCKVCHDRCNGSSEYEYTQCHGHQNRNCKYKTTLPNPEVSSNVILDDLTAAGYEDAKLPYLPLDFEGVRKFNFERGLKGFGSDFWIEVEIKHFQPIGQFKSVNHSDSMKPSDFTGDKLILEKYCPYPVPLKYELKYTKHYGVSYKGNTTRGLDSLKPCDSDPYSFPDFQDIQAPSVVCSEPGPLSDIFHQIDTEDFRTTETVWEEISESCKRQHEACENCSRNCIQNMPFTSTCSVTVNDDNGRSPRLPLCYACCAKSNCSDQCKNYHDERCQLAKCQKGNLVQFQLRSIYPAQNNFYCHVEQVLDQHLIKVEYKVKYRQWTNRLYLLYRNLSVYSDEQWQKTGKISKKDDIIHIEIDTRLTEMPNFIQRTPNDPIMHVGKYEVKGDPLDKKFISADFINIRPLKPFGINPQEFGKQRCEDILLKDVVVAVDKDSPYRVMSDLFSITMDDTNATYLITNKTVPPTVKIGLNKDTSILKAIFKPIQVEYKTLTGRMNYNTSHWILVVDGLMTECPGFFNLNVSDAAYPDTPLYQFDVGIECPKTFKLTFMIPTNDSPLLSKDLLVHVKDTNSTFLLRVHKPALITQETMEKELAKPEILPSPSESVAVTPSTHEPAHFNILFIAVVTGVILLLFFLLIFGVAWKQGIPEGDIQRFHLRHLVLLVIYITFQFLYSLIVTMSVFVLIVIAVNGETTSFLKQYNQQRSVTTALSQLELDTMEHHLTVEIDRQNIEAVTRKTGCHSNIHKLVEDIHKMMVTIETQSINAVQKQNLKDLITVHTKTTLDQYSTDLIQFRDNYNIYTTYVLQKLVSEVDSTILSIERSKWLKGAQFLYKFVKNYKELLSSTEKDSIMSFMAWVNMETDMRDYAKGLTLTLPDLFNLSKNFDASALRSPYRSPDPSSSAHLSDMTYNHWLLQPNLFIDNSTTTPQSAAHTKHITTLSGSSYTPFVICMIIIDLLWVLHRMVKTCGIGKLLLYGYPIYVDVRDQKDGEEEKKKINKKSWLKICGTVFDKALSTFFIPKLIGTLFVCLMVYFVSVCAYKFINRQTFTYLGYYNDMEDMMSINEAVINTRIASHSERINKLEYPMYESVMNTNIQNHQYILNLVETQWHAIQQAHTKLYCNYLRRINVTASCHDDSREATLTDIRLDGCYFPPIVPEFYERNVTDSSKIAGSQMDGFLMNIRKLVWDTSYVIIIYLSGIVIKELLGSVLWIYIKRSGFVILRIIYETDEAPGSADTSTTNK